MIIFVKKTISGLAPASITEFDKMQEAKLKMGEFYEVEIKKKRNYEHHKKLFALFNICFNNQEWFENIDDLRDYITMKSGFGKKIVTPEGEFHKPKSISFSSMDQIEFNDYYNKCVFQVMKLVGVEKEDLLNEINSF